MIKMEKISCKNISKTYTGGKKALKNVSFSFNGTGIISLIGKNGAGKTTLIRILSTELAPTSGNIHINDIDIIKNPELIREKIAIVPQEARAIQWLTPKQTIISYLMYRGYGFVESSKKAQTALKKVSLDSKLNKMNRILSGGTKRKVLVATVISSGAKIIFLDEPTTGLDPISRNELWNVLKKLKNDYLIILTTHYLEEAERLADKIGIMDEGKLLAFDTIDGLRKKIKYNYSLKVYGEFPKLKSYFGKVIKGIDNNYQILTDEKGSYELSKIFIKKRIHFSTNPLSLEDIFYYMVKKPITEERDEDDGW